MSTENTALTVVGQQAIEKGGIGFGSKVFQLKPANIQVVQRMSKAVNSVQPIPGKLRIGETGEHFDEMQVVLIAEPQERRSFFEGEDFTPESMVCFSHDMVKPDKGAKVPQAFDCASCPKASWDKYQQTRNRKDIPSCKNFWFNLLIDRKTKLPYILNVRSTSIKPYLKGMQDLARQAAKAKSEGQNCNIFDFTFTIASEPQEKGQYFTLQVKDVKPIADADRAEFGKIFLEITNRGRKANDAALAEEAAKQEAAIDAEVVTPGSAADQTVTTI